MLRFILGIVALGITVFFLVYFLSAPAAEHPPPTRTVEAPSDAPDKPGASKVKAKRSGGDEEDDAEEESDDQDQSSADDALQQRLEQRMDRQ